MNTKNCVYCGKIFSPKKDGARVKHCSDKCFAEHRKERHRESARKNYNNWDSVKNKKSKMDVIRLEVLACVQCGQQFKPNKNNWTQQKYCSSKCRDRHKKKIPETRECVECGKEFPTDGQNKCQDCRTRKPAFKKMEVRVCKKCNSIFIALENTNQAYCSAECRDTPITYKHKCEICGKEFENYQPQQFACPGECKAKRDRKKEQNILPHTEKYRKDFLQIK